MESSPADSVGRGLLGRLGSVGDQIAAADPALSRLRLASRAMLSLALSGLILAAITWLIAPLPIAAYGMAVVISFVGSMAVRDPGGRAQVVTRAIGWIVAVGSTLLATTLTPLPLLADLTFLVVVFAAVYVRKYGPRWFAIGMIAFMGYFMGDYLRPALTDAGWIAAAVAIAMAATHVVSGLVLRDDPERDFRRAMNAIEHRINLILRELLPDGSGNGAREVPARHLSRLRDAVMMAEGFIPQGEKGALAAGGASSDLAIALFELQLALERLVAASHVEAPSPAAVRALLNRTAVPVADGAPAATRLAARVGRALQNLQVALGPAPSPAFRPPEATTLPVAAGAADAPAARPLVPLDLQAPIQVTLACAIALGGGLLLSPVRWYWAVITAFIVFNNARSRADTALRALQRSFGTFAGLFVGTAAATIVHGELAVSAIAILALFFVGFYFVQVSYSLMIFLITIALALLYGVMGMFTPELLVLRLEETLVGGVAGALVAFFVFPARTSVGAAAALEKYLSALGDLVKAAKARADGEAAGNSDLAGLSRSVDRLYTDLATTVRPIGGPWGIVTRFGEVREKLLLLASATHWGRVLARSLWPGRHLDADAIARIDRAAESAVAHIGDALRRKDLYFERPRPSETTLAAQTPWPAAASTNDDDPAFALEVIAALIARASAG
jgi:uncharacterized membrane protein YccC